MATFNSMPPLSSGGAPADAMGLNAGQSLPMEGFEQEMTFDPDYTLDAVNGTLPMPFPAYDFENFATTFEDPFSYPARPSQYEAPPDPDNAEPSSPEQLDNKLLGFSAPIPRANLMDDTTGAFTDVPMSAELYGMFFVAEDVFAADANTGSSGPRPLELTCYRRNLWQCSGQITLPRQVSHVINDQGRNVPIYDLAASISAIESIDGKATEIISIPWKSSNATAEQEALSKVASAPPNVPLDLSSGTEIDATRVSLPVAWKRLQFKHATANNGRRKGLQQHYVVQINLMGKMKSGEWMKICEIQSGPVIVRGRSPRNFDGRKDVPLMGEKKVERRSTTSSDGVKTEKDTLTQNFQRYHSLGNIQQTAEWTTPQPYTPPNQGAHPAKKMATSPNPNRPPIPSWGSQTSTSANTPPPGSAGGGSKTTGRTNSAVPISLSLSEDERSPSRNSAEIASPRFSKTSAAQAPNQSPMEDADMLYEYFPLSVDDWLPPVDAVYRPHIVHHTIVPPEVKAQQMRVKTKRYFAPD